LYGSVGWAGPLSKPSRADNMTNREKKNLRNGLLFVSPWILGISFFILYPVCASFYYSLCEYSVLMPAQFIGLGNYADLMSDDVFWKAMINTVYYAVVALPLGTIIAILLALLLNADIKGRTIFRTIFFIPTLVPLIALAILWIWIFNGEYGVLNYLLSFFGIQGPDWFGNPHWAMPSLIMTSLWGCGQAMVIYLAGLQDVPVELYEVAELDGAQYWSKIWHITLPLISPVIYFNVIIGIINTFQIFAVPFVINAPARSLLFYTVYIYDNAFRYLRMGYASAMAWILFIIILLLSGVATKYSKKYIYYAGK
jgi:multiple sugar transport system permease protein